MRITTQYLDPVPFEKVNRLPVIFDQTMSLLLFISIAIILTWLARVFNQADCPTWFLTLITQRGGEVLIRFGSLVLFRP